MFINPGYLAAAGVSAGPAPFSVLAVEYDGTNDRLKHLGPMAGATDSKQGTFSCWIKANAGMDGSLRRFFTISTTAGNWRVIVLKGGATETFTFHAKNSAGTQLLQCTTTATRSSANGWYHIMFAYDLNVPKAIAVVDGAIGTNNQILVAGTVQLARSTDDWWAGAEEGTTKLDGCLTQVYFHDVFVDLATLAGREKFIKDGKPVDLGANGELPTGTQPIVFLKKGNLENAGTGADYVLTGSTPACATSPSD